jgi:hypothetical protein
MININQEISRLHDARVFGFLLDSNPVTLDLNFILYVQRFLGYENDEYDLEKSLVVFESTVIKKLSISDDIYNGQFFITDIEISEFRDSNKWKFTFSFNDDSFELVIAAENMIVIPSGKIEKNVYQHLFTDWVQLLK